MPFFPTVYTLSLAAFFLNFILNTLLNFRNSNLIIFAKDQLGSHNVIIILFISTNLTELKNNSNHI